MVPIILITLYHTDKGVLIKCTVPDISMLILKNKYGLLETRIRLQVFLHH